jgi:hypothetical protein
MGKVCCYPAGSLKNEPAFLFLTINYWGNGVNDEWK